MLLSAWCCSTQLYLSCFIVKCKTKGWWSWTTVNIVHYKKPIKNATTKKRIDLEGKNGATYCMTHIVWYLCGLFRLSKSLESAGRKVAFPPGNMKHLRIFIGVHRGTISQSQTAHLKESGQFEFTHSDIPPSFSRDRLALLGGKLWDLGVCFQQDWHFHGL